MNSHYAYLILGIRGNVSLQDEYAREPEKFRVKRVDQVIKFAGEGRLLDGSTTSKEFRDLLRVIDIPLLKEYSETCLNSKFEDVGLALQDIINEVGNRLGFDVEPGKYRSCPYDGLWISPEGRVIVVECKKTSEFSIELKKIEAARLELIQDGKATNSNSSGLLIVGVGETDFLEAQIRGSKFAWEMRMITASALFKLLTLKTEFDHPNSAKRVRRILSPEEYTKLDPIIELLEGGVMDTETREISIDEEDIIEDGEEKTVKKRIPPEVAKLAAEKIGEHLGFTPVKDAFTSYISSDKTNAFVVMASSYIESANKYWYGFREHNYEFCNKFESSFAGFACGKDIDALFLIPFQEFSSMTEGMRMTTFDDNRSDFWHVEIKPIDGKYFLGQRRGKEKIDITKFMI